MEEQKRGEIKGGRNLHLSLSCYQFVLQISTNDCHVVVAEQPHCLHFDGKVGSEHDMTYIIIYIHTYFFNLQCLLHQEKANQSNETSIRTILYFCNDMISSTLILNIDFLSNFSATNHSNNLYGIERHWTNFKRKKTMIE